MSDRLKYSLVVVLAAVLVLSAGSCATKPSGGARYRSTRDATFLVTSDCHYDAFENEDRNERNRDTIKEMNAIARGSWPEKLGGGPIRQPRGVLVLGDIIDDGDRRIGDKNQSAQQYSSYVADFGFDGNDGLLQYPVYECWGNHDGPPAERERFGFSFQAQLKKRSVAEAERMAHRPFRKRVALFVGLGRRSFCAARHLCGRPTASADQIQSGLA
jgi:hypothetical protein